MASKIIVCGFPHCGTSILKSIISHIDDVEEIINETNEILIESSKKYILCKTPFSNEVFFKDKFYNEYIKIFIIRNPIFVFSSLNKRFQYNIPINHEIQDYINVVKLFINYNSNKLDNIYTIKYEDMFNNNYQNLKNIFNKIGFIYNDDIFNNSNYNGKNQILDGLPLLNEKPLNTDHVLYRTWQINQPFINNNSIDKIDLTKEQINILCNDKDILYLYPDIKELIINKEKDEIIIPKEKDKILIPIEKDKILIPIEKDEILINLIKDLTLFLIRNKNNST
jgi:hypothetical protein